MKEANDRNEWRNYAAIACFAGALAVRTLSVISAVRIAKGLAINGTRYENFAVDAAPSFTYLPAAVSATPACGLSTNVSL